MGGAIAACRRGAIVPNTSGGFDQVEASASPEHAVNVVKFESVQSDPAPRRRRGGRRVVRGVGAAGASLELKVEEHASAPLFEEPKLPVAQPAHDTGDSADSEGMTRPTRRRRRPVQSDDDVREIADERPTRSRRRRSVQVEDEQDEDRPSRRRSRFADDADEYDEMPRRRASVDDSHDEESSVERAFILVIVLTATTGLAFIAIPLLFVGFLTIAAAATATTGARRLLVVIIIITIAGFVINRRIRNIVEDQILFDLFDFSCGTTLLRVQTTGTTRLARSAFLVIVRIIIAIIPIIAFIAIVFGTLFVGNVAIAAATAT